MVLLSLLLTALETRNRSKLLMTKNHKNIESYISLSMCHKKNRKKNQPLRMKKKSNQVGRHNLQGC